MARSISTESIKYLAQHTNMIAAVKGDEPLITTGREGARTVAVCRAVVESAATGKTVEIHAYDDGGHGVGLGKDYPEYSKWLEQSCEFLAEL